LSKTQLRRLIPLWLVITFIGLTGCSNIKVRLAMNEGVNFYKSKEFLKAAASFRKAIKLDPSYAEAYLDLGLTYMELYEPGSEHPKDLEYADGAIESFKRYIRLYPETEKARDYLINICKLSMRMQDAIDFFLEDYQKNPNDLVMVKTMAALYRMAGDMENAIAFYQKAAELEPDNPEAYYSVGVACWGRSYNSLGMDYEARMELLDRGLAALQKAMELRPEYFEALTYYSLTYREKAKYDISPAAAVGWRQKADELLAQAMEVRNKQLAAQAAEAAGTAPGGKAGAQETTPAKTGGE